MAAYAGALNNDGNYKYQVRYMMRSFNPLVESIKHYRISNLWCFFYFTVYLTAHWSLAIAGWEWTHCSGVQGWLTCPCSSVELRADVGVLENLVGSSWRFHWTEVKQSRQLLYSFQKNHFNSISAFFSSINHDFFFFFFPKINAFILFDYIVIKIYITDSIFSHKLETSETEMARW